MTVVTRLRRPALVRGNSTLPEIEQVTRDVELDAASTEQQREIARPRRSNSSKEAERQVNPANPAHPGPGSGEQEGWLIVFKALADELEVSGTTQRASDDVAHESEPRTRDEFDRLRSS